MNRVQACTGHLVDRRLGDAKATALRFAQRGWTFIGAAGCFEKAPEITDNGAITTVTLDVSGPGQSRAVAAEVVSRHDVDVLYNNADICSWDRAS